LSFGNHFKRLEVKLMRGTTTQVAEFMKIGSAELAIASSLGDAWDRLDTWPLFSEGFVLAVGSSHRLAGRNSLQLSDVRGEALLMRTYSEYFESLSSVLRSHGFRIDQAHEMPSEHDLEVFLEQGLGVAFVPQSVLFSDCVKRVPVTGLDLRRTVSLYGVAGRQRTPVANMIMKMLRAADWSRYTS
jgi:DNA-binding transcriptional LysR family regulator